MSELPIPVIIGTVMIVVGIGIGIYVAIQAIGRSKKDKEFLS
jgi:uncharacterized protein YneF (UPF0154 family)